MKKRILIINILLMLSMQMPISVYAENETASNYKADVTLKYNQEKQQPFDNIPETGCEAIYVANPETGKVIYEKNAHKKMYPASTTKILTALLTMENCKLEDTAIVTQHALDMVPQGSSNANLQAGEEQTIKDLLYALLLPSANEAANTLAEHISGSIEEFAELANKRAKELGCEMLHFTNANGLHDENHYCTAYDLYLVAKECQKYEIFNEIVKTKTYKLPATSKYSGTRTLKNTNELLFSGTYYYAYCTGIKTGHTTPAGECLVASSTYESFDLLSVVLGGKSANSKGLNERFYDTKRLYEYTYDNYSIKQIAQFGDKLATLDVGKATNDTAILDVIVDTDISTILPNGIDKENVKTVISINDDIVAPIAQNQALGKITYFADGLEYTTNIIASHSVEKLPYTRYNITVIVSLIITFSIFSLILKLFKKHRKIVLTIETIIFVGACVVIFPYIKEDVKNTFTPTTVISEMPDNQATIETQDLKDGGKNDV